MIQPLWRTVWRFLKKLKIELPYNPEIPLLDIYLEKTIIQKYAYTQCLQQHYLQEPAHGSDLNILNITDFKKD